MILIHSLQHDQKLPWSFTFPSWLFLYHNWSIWEFSREEKFLEKIPTGFFLNSWVWWVPTELKAKCLQTKHGFFQSAWGSRSIQKTYAASIHLKLVSGNNCKRPCYKAKVQVYQIIGQIHLVNPHIKYSWLAGFPNQGKPQDALSRGTMGTHSQFVILIKKQMTMILAFYLFTIKPGRQNPWILSINYNPSFVISGSQQQQ